MRNERREEEPHCMEIKAQRRPKQFRGCGQGQRSGKRKPGTRGYAISNSIKKRHSEDKKDNNKNKNKIR